MGEALSKVIDERDTSDMTNPEYEVVQTMYDKTLEEVMLLPKLRAIKKSFWDHNFYIFPSLLDQVEYHLEFDDINK